MSWIRVVLTRLLVAQVVHLVLVVVQPGVRVNHLLVVVIVFLVSTAFGVTTSNASSADRH